MKKALAQFWTIVTMVVTLTATTIIYSFTGWQEVLYFTIFLFGVLVRHIVSCVFGTLNVM